METLDLIKSRVLTGTHFMLGEHACAEGALAADLNFFAGYPITPSTEIRVATIIVVIGFEVTHDAHLMEFGYGKHTDVVTAMELQRLLQTPSPTGGFVTRPSMKNTLIEQGEG